MSNVRIVALAGSLRSGSFNKKLIKIAATGARAAGAAVTEVDLRDIPLPLYDGDVEREHGLPPNAKVFKRLLIEHHGFLISSPEYNSAISAVLKNAIDWASRPVPNEPAPRGSAGMSKYCTARVFASMRQTYCAPRALP